MEETKTLTEMTKNASSKLLDSIYLLETLEEMFDGSGKECTILTIILKNVNIAFNEISECRRIISID